MTTRPLRLDRRALLELQALLSVIAELRDEGGPEHDDGDQRHRRVIQRLWIAVGNEADAYAHHIGARGAAPLGELRGHRNTPAHTRLSDVDDDSVWQDSATRPEPLLTRMRGLILRDLPRL